MLSGYEINRGNIYITSNRNFLQKIDFKNIQDEDSAVRLVVLPTYIYNDIIKIGDNGKMIAVGSEFTILKQKSDG
jgi:hypothetical protein